ncbi:MAG: chemotaxis protein CheX [Magnetococcales bacterium]|nr:chemotaxis protein CheX [Magnetococcales bacterium]
MRDSHSEENKQKILNSLRLTVVEIMATMAMSEVIFSGKESSNDFRLNREASGLVRLYGSHEGMIAICCNLSLLKNIVCKIVGLPDEDLLQEDLLDGAAELANMIGGGMKSKAQIPGVILSPPMSIIGTEYIANWKTNRPTEILTFQMEEGILQIQASL